MSKAASPMRLEKSLVSAAKEAAQLFQRSTAEQVEYWAGIGSKLEKNFDPETLIAIASGLLKVKVEPVQVAPINSDDVFAKLEADRASGSLSAKVSQSAVQYQASAEYPGYLEQLSEGGVVVGQFSGGDFIPK